MTAKVSFRDNETIRREADQFRNSTKLSGHSTPPIDVIYIAEVILKLNIIPLPDLRVKQNLDAALLPDLTGFYIDESAYLSWEAGKQWIENRLRFSFAHELGHLILHGHEISRNKFDSISDFKIWAGCPSNYESAEYQADEFAGRFLVPQEYLFKAYDEYGNRFKRAGVPWMEIEGMREFLARKLAPRFGVNHQVIATRFDREGIWPVE